MTARSSQPVGRLPTAGELAGDGDEPAHRVGLEHHVVTQHAPVQPWADQGGQDFTIVVLPVPLGQSGATASMAGVVSPLFSPRFGLLG